MFVDQEAVETAMSCTEAEVVDKQIIEDPKAISGKSGMQRRSIALLSAGHLVADISQGTLPALLPFLISAHGLKFSQAGGIMLAMSAGSSVVQPVFGYFADRLAKPWLMAVGLLLAGLGVSMSGIATTYWGIVAAAAISGLGIAAFHPEAARLANRAAGESKATGMSIFSFGGNAGFACGPLLTAGAYLLFGLRGTLLLAMPSVVMAVILLTQLHRFSSSASSGNSHAGHTAGSGVRDSWGAFSWLSLVVVIRSVIFYALITFLPLYWIHVLGQSKQAGSSMLTLLFGVGALGTLLGGTSG